MVSAHVFRESLGELKFAKLLIDKSKTCFGHPKDTLKTIQRNPEDTLKFPTKKQEIRENIYFAPHDEITSDDDDGDGSDPLRCMHNNVVHEWLVCYCF